MPNAAPEELLHLLGPFLPTDRFRALLQGNDLPETAQGTALMVDLSGFTPLTAKLVQEFGARQAGDELRRMLNRMFEATTGQVFQHGGSVIRFVGDGFMAWFDDDQQDVRGRTLLSALRASAAAIAMQDLMRSLFRDISLRIGIGCGMADRWVIGQARYGLSDVLSGPAVQATIRAVEQALPSQIVIDPDMRFMLENQSVLKHSEATGEWILVDLDAAVKQATRQHRWPAWESVIDSEKALDLVRQYVDVTLRAPIESGLGSFTSELRWACPMFIRINPATTGSHDARTMLNHCVGTIQDVLAETGGRLVSVEVSDKGSVVFAVFGAPMTYGDDAQRAVNAAFMLRKNNLLTMEQYCTLQFGLSRGLLYAGIVGGEARHEYSTIGYETNIAARLMSAANPGQILITSHLRESLKRGIRWRDLAPIGVKGRIQPVSVSEALDSDQVSRKPAQTYETVFIGRQTELAQFASDLNAVSQGATRIVTIEGNAGVGKSRLLSEMRQQAEQYGCRVAQGNCLSTGRTASYLPWREILGMLFNLGSDLPNEANIKRLIAFFAEVNPQWTWRLPLLSELLQLPLPGNPTAAGLSGRNRQQALSSLVIDLLRHFTAQQPLVISFEDIHWIDELSESLLLDLVRETRIIPIPLCVALSYRPLAGERGGALLNTALADYREGDYTALSLSEFSSDEVEAIAEQRLHASPSPDLIAFLIDHAGGNPFLIHEVLDVLNETHALVYQKNKVSLAQSAATIKMPSTPQELVQARIDRLDETDKLILKVASVVGRQFSLTMVEQSVPYPIPRADLINRLETLEAMRFSRREVAEAGLVYRFDHAIIQDVVYQSLPFEQREQIHQLVGTALRKVEPEQVEQLAYHFVRSNREYRGIAQEYLIQAANNAIAEYANQSALTFLEQAIPLSDDPVIRFKLRCSRLDILLRIGQLNGIEAEINRLAQSSLAQVIVGWQAEIGLRRAQYLAQIGSRDLAIADAAQAWQTAVESMQDLTAWEIGLLLFSLYRLADDHEAIERLLPDMNAIVMRLDDPRKHIQLALQELSELYIERPIEAFAGVEAVLEEAQSLADAGLEAACWSLMSTIYSARQNYPASRQAIDNELVLYRRIGSRHDEGDALYRLGWTLTLVGQLSEASNALTQSYTIMHQLGEQFGEASSLIGLGIIAWLRFAYDEALAYLNRSMALLTPLKADAELGQLWFYIGNVRLSKGDIDAAKQAFQSAVNLLQSKGRRVYAAAASAGLAELSLYQGNLNDAERYINPITELILNNENERLLHLGLDYWRAAVVNRTLNSPVAATLTGKARDYRSAILTTLNHPIERSMFTEHVWYIKAIHDLPGE